MSRAERQYLSLLEGEARRLRAENSDLREALDAVSSDPGMRAVLADCRARLSLALSAVELGAYPGPEWRAGTAQLIALLDTVKP